MAESNNRILIIDDQTEIHEDIRKILSFKTESSEFDKIEEKLFDRIENKPEKNINPPSYKIDSAYEGKEGFELVKKACELGKPYALAFVDVRIPTGWDGIETIKHIWKKDPNIQIIICTAHSDYSWKSIVVQLGVSDNYLILKKPFDPIEIIQIASALRKKWELTHKLMQQIESLESAVAKRTKDLSEAKQFAERANQIKTDFLRNVTHELITPLHGIIGGTELLSNEKVGAQEKNELINDILTNANHLFQMISDILYFTTIETHEFEQTVKPEQFELEKMIYEVKKMFNKLIEEKKLEFIVEIDSSLSFITTDLTQFKRVLFHLISNAIKFTQEKGTIKVRATPLNREQFRLEVIDSGIGIKKEEIAKLFVPFQQLDAGMSKKYRGLGIGLALVKHIVESQGGEVGVEAPNGSGATFFITLALH